MITPTLRQHVERAYLRGKDDEAEVMRLLTDRGYRVEPAKEDTDMHAHIDLFIILHDRVVGVDVKGSYKQHNDGIWIEVRNVNGKDGWIYGRADYIAFVFPDVVAFIHRPLLQHVAEKVDYTYITTVKPHRCYVPYRREGRNDLMFKVEEDFIRDNATIIINR